MLSSILKKERAKRDLSQEEVARAIGVSQPTYNYYESGTKVPSLAVVMSLADYFDVSIDYLVGRKDV